MRPPKRRSRDLGTDFCAVEQRVMFEHAEDVVEQLAHDGDQGLHFGFAAHQQLQIEGAHMRLMAADHQGGHAGGTGRRPRLPTVAP